MSISSEIMLWNKICFSDRLCIKDCLKLVSQPINILTIYHFSYKRYG